MDVMEHMTIFLSWLLQAILLSISIYFIYSLTSNKSSVIGEYSKVPPGPRKLPLIGNLHQLPAKNRHQTLWQLSQKYGPVMLLHIGHRPLLIISSSEMAKQVLKTNDLDFCSRPPFKGTKLITYNYLDIAFSPYNDHWKEMRKVFVSELLSPKRVRFFNQVMETEIERLVRSLSLLPSNTLVNLDEKFMDLMGAVVCEVGFGKKYNEDFTSGKVKEMLEGAFDLFGGFCVGDYFPKFGWILDELSGRNANMKKFFRNIDGFIQAVLDEHLDCSAKRSDHEKDFVEVLIDLSSCNGDLMLTKDEMKAILMDVLTGGTDTTVVTMVWAMSEMAENPLVMQKLQAEIRNIVGRKHKIDASDITKMTYLKMVVKETLRLHPPAPLLVPRECLRHCQIGGFDIFPGTNVLINAWGIARDPSTWKEKPDEFYPERFENIEFDFVGKYFEMIPFGGGRRSCPGYNTAIGTTEFTLANLLYWFDWKVPTGGNEGVGMEDEGVLVVRNKSHVCLVPMKHNW